MNNDKKKLIKKSTVVKYIEINLDIQNQNFLFFNKVIFDIILQIQSSL